MAHTITLTLPDTLFEQLKQTADLAHQSPEEIIKQSLAHSLPPLLKDIPAEYQGEVYPLLNMSQQELQKEVGQVFPSERWAKYEALLTKKKESQLTLEEKNLLDQLRHDADILTFRKGYAAVLLKRQGFTPYLPDLPHAQ